MAAKAEEPTAQPRIVLAFAGPDRADVAARLDGVTPAQLFLAAWYLDALAREVRQGQLQQAALGALAPGGQAELDRIVQDIMGGRTPQRRS
jgi:hypothetical protein